MPPSYPESLPVFCIRSDILNSTQQHKLNSSLQEFLCKLTKESVSCGILNEIVQWITENFPRYTDQSNAESFQSDVSLNSAVLHTPTFFSRLWIYSHHIYNREKRRTIIDTARELDLTGFSAPGKPGIICIEGCKPSADNFWQQIRSLQWQRITLTHREDSAVSSDVNSLRRFDSFEEKCFVNQNASSHGTHLDRGQLLQFLQQKGCKDVFHYYFGIDGKEDSLSQK